MQTVMRGRIFAMSLIKNEADVIAESLAAAATWCDAIFVLDNGSNDATWEIVLDLAKTFDCIVPFRQDARPFRDSLRGEIFEYFRHQSAEGDWWCALDADEFYIDSPPEFLARVPSSFDVVWTAKFQYYFTEQDLARYRSNPSAFEALPVAQKCRYYLNDWSDPRFFRYHESLRYHERAWPQPLGPSFGERIRLKHFQYRSPKQIAKRLATRRRLMNEGMFRHEAVANWARKKAFRRPKLPASAVPHLPVWRERIVDSRYLLCDSGDPYVIAHHALPPIYQLS